MGQNQVGTNQKEHLYYIYNCLLSLYAMYVFTQYALMVRMAALALNCVPQTVRISHVTMSQESVFASPDTLECYVIQMNKHVFLEFHCHKCLSICLLEISNYLYKK